MSPPLSDVLRGIWQWSLLLSLTGLLISPVGTSASHFLFVVSKADEQLIIDAVIAKIPTWKAGLLTDAGCVLLTKVTLSAIPVHISIASCLSAWVIKEIDKRRRDSVSSG